MRRPELSEHSRVTSSRLRLFRRLCHRDPHNAAFCRELQPLAARLAPRNSTAGLWAGAAARWPQGLHKALARKNSLEDLKVEAFAGSQGQAANASTTASVESPLPGASPTADSSQAEPLRAPGTERWHLISWAKQSTAGWGGRAEPVLWESPCCPRWPHAPVPVHGSCSRCFLQRLIVAAGLTRSSWSVFQDPVKWVLKDLWGQRRCGCKESQGSIACHINTFTITSRPSCPMPPGT